MTATFPQDPALNALINLDRYPVANPDLWARETARYRQELNRHDAVCLDGFLTSTAVQLAIADIESHLPEAFRKQRTIPVSTVMPELPPGHPATTPQLHDMRVLATDQLAADGPLRRIYASPAVCTAVAGILGIPELFPCADPLLALVVTAMSAGQGQGWHFDDNDFVASILLQQPASGGEFEYVPGLSGQTGIDADAVGDILTGDHRKLHRLGLTAGTLTLFQGRHTLHRVSPVGGPPDRLIALLSYHSQPGMVFAPVVQKNNTGRTRPPQKTLKSDYK